MSKILLRFSSQLILHNKPTAEVHPGHKLMSPKEEEISFLLIVFR
jgi:hypothetical protein